MKLPAKAKSLAKHGKLAVRVVAASKEERRREGERAQPGAPRSLSAPSGRQVRSAPPAPRGPGAQARCGRDISATCVKGAQTRRPSRRVRRYCGLPDGPRPRSSRPVRLRRLPPRAARGVRGRAGRPRRARGDAHRLGQVALLPAPGAAARRPDRRRLAAGGAHAGPGRGARRRAGWATGWRWSTPSRTARPTPTCCAGRRPGSCACSTWRPSASRPRASSSGWPRCAWACSSSTRRTASPSGATTSGPTTSGWPTPRGCSARRRWSPPPPRPRRGWRSTSQRRLGLRDPLRVATGFDRPNIAFAVARPGGHEKRALVAEALREPDALPAIVYAGTRAGSEELAAELSEALGEEAVAYHAGLDRERRADGAAPLPRRRGAGDLRDQRVRHGRGQAQRADGGARERARLARGLLPGGRARRPRRPPGAGAAAGGEPRQGPARALHQARARSTSELPGWLADRIAAAADGDGPLLARRARAGARPGRRRGPAARAARPPHAGAA